MPRISQVRTHLQTSRSRQKGTAIVVFTLFVALVAIPMAGLAVDTAVVFWAKAKLSAAVDAAALAAGRSVNSQQTQNQNATTVQQIGQQWFTANFPTGWLGTTLPTVPSISLTLSSSSAEQVNVSASAVVPLYFMRVVGYNSLTISASAQSSRRDAFVVLVLDRSGSMGSNAWGNACPVMQQDAINFTNVFQENFDTLSLVTFSTSAGPNPDYGPSTTFIQDSPNIATKIKSLSCTGWTSTAQGLAIAYQAIQNHGLKTGLNAIVLFTDGQPNAITATFPVMTAKLLGGKQDNRYGPYPPGYSGYANYNTESPVGASGCPSTLANITGTIAAAPYSDLSGTINVQPKGMTFGIYDFSSQVPLSTSANLLSGSAYSGCNFNLNSGYHAQTFESRYDIAYLPATDYYKNQFSSGTQGYYGPNLPAPQLFPNDANHVFGNYLRPDLEQAGVTAAAINAADYQAQQIRNDTTFNPVIYTIGLGGAPDYAIDFTLLERIANDPQSPIYDNARPTGAFKYASDPTQLAEAFQDIASEILQLTR